MKAKKAIAKIEEIMGLEYDGYGEVMHPVERVAMIASVMRRYKESNRCLAAEAMAIAAEELKLKAKVSETYHALCKVWDVKTSLNDHMTLAKAYEDARNALLAYQEARRRAQDAR